MSHCFLVSVLKVCAVYLIDLNRSLSIQDGRMLDASPTKISATGVTLNTSTRKGGGLKQAKKQMQVGCLAVFLGEGC